MPSTYDPLLRLELQATGENATTWGVKTNTNLDLLAESIAGAVTLNVAGSGDYTLTTANGAEDEARQAILVLTGTLTGNRNIIVPSSPKNYTVINNTTGAFTVTLKQSGGSGVALVSAGPTMTVCTSTTCIDAIGASPFGHAFIAETSAGAARTALGLANTATLVATSVGTALITAADTSAGRSAIEAAKSGDITASGLTMSSAKLLGRSTSATGVIEEVSVGSGLTFTGGVLGLSPQATPQVREQVFVSSGSWVAPTDVTQVRVLVIGAGGGGSGRNDSTQEQGGIGGVGGIAIGIVSVVPATSYTITVGTGGTAGGNNVNGSAGGSSSFGAFVTATGGGGGFVDLTTPTKGAGSNGSLRNGNLSFVNAGPFTGNTRSPGSGTTGQVWSVSTSLGAGQPGEGGEWSSPSRAGAGGVNGIVYLQWVAV